MGDKLCTFLDCTSFITFSPPHYKLHKPIFTLLPNLQFLNPTPTCTSCLTRTRKRKSRLLNLTVLCAPISSTPSSLDFDIVSTSEGSDGSFVFRFGDASEAERIRELEESRKSEELRELEECSNEVSNELKVLDGNDEEEVIAKPIEIEELNVKEEHSDFLPASSEFSGQVTDERVLQADILDTNGNESSTPGIDSENVYMTEKSIQKDRGENSTSTSMSLFDNSLIIEGKILEENIDDESMFDSGNVSIVPQSDEGGIEDSVQAVSVRLEHNVEENNNDDSMSDSGNLTDSVTEVPQTNDACKDNRQDSGSSVTAGFKEPAQAESIETPVMLNESSSISTLQPEIAEVLIGYIDAVSDDEAIEVEESSGDLTELLGAGADMQLTGSHIIGYYPFPTSKKEEERKIIKSASLEKEMCH